jgi:hypothetical protein
MKLRIDDKRPISEIQDEFNAAFPYLKIEFFKKPHRAGEASPIGEMLSSDSDLGKWRTNHTEGELVFTKDSTVEEVESKFQEAFGLSVQVFRKSGNVWLETSATDSWTLAEQNEQGAFMQEDVGE